MGVLITQGERPVPWSRLSFRSTDASFPWGGGRENAGPVGLGCGVDVLRGRDWVWNVPVGMVRERGEGQAPAPGSRRAGLQHRETLVVSRSQSFSSRPMSTRGEVL
jgi:hypothetical protein